MDIKMPWSSFGNTPQQSQTPIASSVPHDFVFPSSADEERPPTPPSPVVHAIDFHGGIPEDIEETASEATEPLTPTSDAHPQLRTEDHVKPAVANGRSLPSPLYAVPQKNGSRLPSKDDTSNGITVTSATVPKSSSPPPPSGTQAAPSRPAIKRNASKIKNLFKKAGASLLSTNNDSSDSSLQSNQPQSAVEPRSSQRLQGRPALQRSFYSRSARNTPPTSVSITPPSSSGSPTRTPTAEKSRFEIGPPPDEEHATPRAATDLMQRKDDQPMYSNNRKYLQPARRPLPRKRSSSLTNIAREQPDNYISLPAATGAGLKARRMSTSLPDSFNVDTVELNQEYTSLSILPGKRGKLIGKGATATVKLMARKGSNSDEIYAVKEFRKRGQKEDEVEYEKKVKSEYSIAKSLHHPNIVDTVRLCTHNGRWNHVMEYCAQGELFSLVVKKYFKLEDRLCLFKQLLRGVGYLHSHGIAHRDIKLENLLMTDEGYLKITDFGVSEVFCGEHPGLRAAGGACGKNMRECRRCPPGICGSLPYIAPEVLAKKGDYDPRPLDVWSCAIVYLTMTYTGSPWPSASLSEPYYQKFISGWETWLQKHPDGIITDDPDGGYPKCGPLFSNLPSPAIRRLLLRMMHPDPEKRVSILDALSDRWVKTIECCSPETYEDDVDVASLANSTRIGGPANGGVGVDGTTGTGTGNGTGTPTGSAGTPIVDAAAKESCKVVRSKKVSVIKKHNHLPPAKKKVPQQLQYSFDLGDGYS